MPITALPVKNPTMPGRAWTSSVRKRLSVGVCNAPAIPVRNAISRNAEDVKSNALGGGYGGVVHVLISIMRRDAEFTLLVRKINRGAKSKSASKKSK